MCCSTLSVGRIRGVVSLARLYMYYCLPSISKMLINRTILVAVACCHRAKLLTSVSFERLLKYHFICYLIRPNNVTKK